MPADANRHDPERVVELRAAAFERAGFEPTAARQLAERLEIPLQAALGLVNAGFPPDVAFELLTSGERPVF